MTASEILKLIEEVDPSDTAKLDEIDARVWCYLTGHKYSGYCSGPQTGRISTFSPDKSILQQNVPQYTRSRDALKSIRPGAWHGYSMIYYGAHTNDRFWKCEISCPLKTVASRGLPTEELAELHAIIQSIEHERNSAAGESPNRIGVPGDALDTP